MSTRTQKHNDPVIVVFADFKYLTVLENWLAAVRRIDIYDFLIISLDAKLHFCLKIQNVNSLLRPCEPDLEKLWRHRVDVILELLQKGYDVIHSDADAIWLKDPRPYLDVLPHDMVFSQGTYWPPDVHKKWGFVLCCGFFRIRSNPQTLQFVRELSQRVREDKDDQVSCNRMLSEKGVVWDKPDNMYELFFQNHPFVCSRHVRTGQFQYLKIALLPHVKFQRIFEDDDDVYIRHLVSGKNSDSVLRVLAQHGHRFV